MFQEIQDTHELQKSINNYVSEYSDDIPVVVINAIQTFNKYLQDKLISFEKNVASNFRK
jgi:hypothetical protein